MLAGRNLALVTFAGAALSALIGSGAPASAAAVGITIDGNPVNVSPGPIVRYGRVLVPLRGVFESLDASVVYDSGVITAQGRGHAVTLHIGSTQALIDGQGQTLDVAPFIVGASTYVPLRFVSTALGAIVDYDNTARIVSITSAGYVAQQPARQATVPSYAYDSDQNGQSYENYVTEAPPAIPDYEQPPVPAPDEIWQPGYWGWGPGGYFWVPGTWVEPPQPNLYWTPPYWSFINNVYAFNPGYWAENVGYYGGVNYGAGYYGNGYNGGRWQNGNFYYNTYVTNVTNVTVVKNVYVDRTVVVDRTNAEHPSYNGGPHGTTARPPARGGVVARSGRVPMTQAQVEHQQEAERDRRFLSTVNGGKPPVLVAPRPLSQQATPEGFVPLTETDKDAGARLIAHPPRAVRDDGASGTPKPAPPVLHTIPPHGDPVFVPRPTPAAKAAVTARPDFATPQPPIRMAPPPARTPAPLPLRTLTPRPLFTPERHVRTPEPQVRTPEPQKPPAPAAVTPPPGMPAPHPHPHPKHTPKATPAP